MNYMRAYINDRDYVPYVGIRCHPWSHARDNEDCKYYNFRESPEMIADVLEDFQPVKDTEAAKEFFDLVRWLNSEESIFETNDCAFHLPHANLENAHMAKPVECGGRLMLFFRDLNNNIPGLPSDVAAQWAYEHEFEGATQPLPPSRSMHQLQHFVLDHLNVSPPPFDWASVEITLFETRYVALGEPVQHQFGHLLVLATYAWGDDDAETLKTFGIVTRVLNEILRKANNTLKLNV